MSTEGKSAQVEPAQVPGERAFAYAIIKKKVQAQSGAQAATSLARDPDAAKILAQQFHEGTIRWRSLGCGTPMSTTEEFPDGPGIFEVCLVERRVYKNDGEHVKQIGHAVRFTTSVNRTYP
jgi:hypothetical protein